VRGLAGSSFVCLACSMHNVYGRPHDWGSKACPCCTTVSLARTALWRDAKSTRLVLERAALPLAAVDGLAQDFTKYAAWLLRESADSAPNLRYYFEAVETGQVAVDRRPAGRPGGYGGSE
jgi:hypothetical protein